MYKSLYTRKILGFESGDEDSSGDDAGCKSENTFEN